MCNLEKIYPPRTRWAAQRSRSWTPVCTSVKIVSSTSVIWHDTATKCNKRTPSTSSRRRYSRGTGSLTTSWPYWQVLVMICCMLCSITVKVSQCPILSQVLLSLLIFNFTFVELHYGQKDDWVDSFDSKLIRQLVTQPAKLSAAL